MIAKYFNYKLIKILPIELLKTIYKDHRRLKVFRLKGCKCVSCDRVGTQLAIGKKKNQIHVDLYTDDFVPLTVDHIIPKSLGGSNDITNKQPMCYPCNSKKGNGINKVQLKPEYSEIHKYLNNYTNSNLEIGNEVFIKKGRKIKYLGIISKFCINPHTNKESIMILDNDISMYHLKYILKPLIN